MWASQLLTHAVTLSRLHFTGMAILKKVPMWPAQVSDEQWLVAYIYSYRDDQI